MARLYRASLRIETNYQLDRQAWAEFEQDQIDVYAGEFRAENPGDLVGEIVRWQRADGYAQYMIVKESPLTIAHMDWSDAWAIEAPLIRGLRLNDVRIMVEQEAAMRRLFAEHRSN